MKSILVYGGAFDSGGVESVMMNIIRNVSHKYSFTVIVLREHDGKYDEELKKLNHEIYKIAPMSSQGVLPFYRQLKKIMQAKHFDIIHINGTQSSEIVLCAAKSAGINNRIFHAHNTQDSFINKMPNFTKKTLKNLLSYRIRRNATVFLACGKEAGKFVFGKDFSEFRIVNNSVDLNKFCFVAKEQAASLKKYYINNLCHEVTLLGTAGRFTDVKNQIFAIQLVEKLNETEKTYVLCLAGEGPKLEECKQYVRNHNLSECVIFLGNISKMDEFYKAMDIFLLPSLYEGLPVTCIEAQACGVPIVLSDTITNETDVGMGLMHYVSLNDIDEWISVIKSLKDKKIYNMEKISRKALEDKYSLENLIETMVNIYDSNS